MNQTIILTGGGTAGHVTPNLALIDLLKQHGWTIHYIGSAAGVEKSIIEKTGIPFHAISTGKLRRYFSLQNAIDPFRVLAGLVQAFFLIRRLKAQVVFSKGGFVAFPVVVAAWLNRIPVVAHESDLSPGLANRLCFPFVKKICVTFSLAQTHFKQKEKVVVTGSAIRPQLFQGSREKGLAYCGFSTEKPCLLVIGGSLGANSINRAIREALPALTGLFQVIHICGKGKMDQALMSRAGYCQFEFVEEPLPDLFAAADLIVSRSGSNALYEILALAKPHVLIPLSAQVSRGDQIQNARYFESQGVSTVLSDDNLDATTLAEKIEEVYNQRAAITSQIKSLKIASGAGEILSQIESIGVQPYKSEKSNGLN